MLAVPRPDADRPQGATSRPPCPTGFETIGNGFLPEIGPDTGLPQPRRCSSPLLLSRLPGLPRASASARRAQQLQLRRCRRSRCSCVKLVVARGRASWSFAYLLAQYKGLPIVGLILFALIGIYSFITQRTVFGRHIYAVGGNCHAAAMSGVRTKRVDFLVMVNMGLLAGARRHGVRRPPERPPTRRPASDFELDAIAAAFIGGAAVDRRRRHGHRRHRSVASSWAC